MSLNFKMADEKKARTAEKLLSLLETAYSELDDTIALTDEMVSNCIDFIPPEEPEITLDLVTLNPSGRGGGKSVKPGNIVLNIGSLIDGIANGVFTVASACQVPWLAPFGLLLLYRSLHKASTVELSENEATVFYSMWVFRDRKCNEISQKKLISYINGLLNKYNRKSITQKELDISINKLEKIGCIVKSDLNSNSWYLRERVAVVYR